MSLYINLSPTESMFVNLLLYLLRCILQENGTATVTTTHLRVETLESREELRVESTRLRELESLSYVSSHPEIRILVYTTRDKTENFLFGSEELREGGRHTRYSLDGWESYLTTTLRAVEPKDSFYLVISNVSLYPTDIRIHL